MKIYFSDAAIPAHSPTRKNKNELDTSCISCGEFINHPLCPCCVSKGYRQWIAKFSREEIKSIHSKLNKFMAAHRYLDGKSKRCVSCGELKTHMCPLCFTSYLYKITKEAGVGIKHLGEFLFMFNFDFEKKAYYHEFEAMGGY